MADRKGLKGTAYRGNLGYDPGFAFGAKARSELRWRVLRCGWARGIADEYDLKPFAVNANSMERTLIRAGSMLLKGAYLSVIAGVLGRNGELGEVALYRVGIGVERAVVEQSQELVSGTQDLLRSR